MEVLLAACIAALFGGGLYLVMRRTPLALVVGVVLLSHGANLLLFVSGGLVRARPALVPEALAAPSEPVANPLTQAMLLTAIVIGLGVQVFVVALVRAAVASSGTDVADMRGRD